MVTQACAGSGLEVMRYTYGWRCDSWGGGSGELPARSTAAASWRLDVQMGVMRAGVQIVVGAGAQMGVGAGAHLAEGQHACRRTQPRPPASASNTAL